MPGILGFIKPNQKEGGKDARHLASKDTKVWPLSLNKQGIWGSGTSASITGIFQGQIPAIHLPCTHLYSVLFRASPKVILKHLKEPVST